MSREGPVRRPVKWLGATLLALSVSLGACDKEKEEEPPSEVDLMTCRQAAQRYGDCLESEFSKELADAARAKEKEGIPACARSKKTVEYYRICLPKEDCKAFLKCTTSIAMGEKPE